MRTVIIKNALKRIAGHAGMLLNGLIRTVCGALNAGLIAFSIYGFANIRHEGGYAAVFDFIASCAILTIALLNVYMLGCKKRGKKK
jgi:hypothetical protein